MGFWDVVAPAWTNMYREGELQQLEMARQAAQLQQSPYWRSWMENNPDSSLARSVAHITGLPVAGAPIQYQAKPGEQVLYPSAQGGGGGGGGGGAADQGAPDMGSSAWQPAPRTPYQPPPPPPDASHPADMGQGAVYPPQPTQPYPTPRLIGPVGASHYRYPQTADTPENVSMEGNKSAAALHEVEMRLKEAQLRRLQSLGTGAAGAPDNMVRKGVTVDETTGDIKTQYEPREPGSTIAVPAGTDLGGVGGGGGAQPVPARSPSAAAIPPQVLNNDRAMLGLPPLTGTQQSGQSPASAPPSSAAPGVPAAGVTPPPATPPGAPGATPPGPVAQVPPQTGTPPGVAPVSGPMPTAPQGVDALGRPVTYTAPHEPTVPPSQARQLRPGGPLVYTKPPSFKQERADMLTTLAEHNPQVRQDIQQYGVASALSIPENSHMVDQALEASKARSRGAPSLTGQLAHVSTAINQAEFLGQPVQMPTELDGKPLPKDIAGKKVSPFSVLTKNAWYTTFGKRVPVLGHIFGPGFGLDVAAGKGDPRAIAIQSYAGAVQNIVRGFGDVGNLSEGEQKTVIDKLMPGENTTEAEATRKHQNLIAFLHVVQDGLQKAQQGGGTNVDGANVFRRSIGLPPIDSWSMARDDERLHRQPEANVIQATPPAEGQTIGPAETPSG